MFGNLPVLLHFGLYPIETDKQSTENRNTITKFVSHYFDSHLGNFFSPHFLFFCTCKKIATTTWQLSIIWFVFFCSFSFLYSFSLCYWWEFVSRFRCGWFVHLILSVVAVGVIWMNGTQCSVKAATNWSQIQWDSNGKLLKQFYPNWPNRQTDRKTSTRTHRHIRYENIEHLMLFWNE